MARRKSITRAIVKRVRMVELRGQLGKTQRAVALDFDVTESFIREIESGRSNPEMKFGFALAKYFGTTVDDLFQDLAD
ncbi:helix-turn-helix transcriptional regulator [Paenibacillus sp. GYB004]|uniref:helix-turn-helix transcriptional regulator n=1 Tax=Paenibacillus sp. GYB004 TaxID=2994393 RepID=UPI002F963703